MNEFADAHFVVAFVPFGGLDDCPIWWQNFIHKSGYLIIDAAGWDGRLNRFLSEYDAYVIVRPEDDDIEYLVFKTEAGATMLMLKFS